MLKREEERSLFLPWKWFMVLRCGAAATLCQEALGSGVREAPWVMEGGDTATQGEPGHAAELLTLHACSGPFLDFLLPEIINAFLLKPC